MRKTFICTDVSKRCLNCNGVLPEGRALYRVKTTVTCALPADLEKKPYVVFPEALCCPVCFDLMSSPELFLKMAQARLHSDAMYRGRVTVPDFEDRRSPESRGRVD